MSNPIEKMTMPCPLDVCDGSGLIGAIDPWDDDRICPHMDTDDYEPDVI